MAINRTAIVLVSMVTSIAANAQDGPGIKIPPAIQKQVEALGCYTCHEWTRRKFGPAWQDVADRYRGKTVYEYRASNADIADEKLPLVQGLVKKVSKGGKGAWNEYLPMIPNDPNGTRTGEITDIVNFILSIPPKR
jgi:cytochrome c551/c552